jgi:hypothetical protein
MSAADDMSLWADRGRGAAVHVAVRGSPYDKCREPPEARKLPQRLVLHGPDRGSLPWFERASPVGAVRPADGTRNSPGAVELRSRPYPARGQRQRDSRVPERLNGNRRRSVYRPLPGWVTAGVGFVALGCTIAAITFTAGTGTAERRSGRLPAPSRARPVGLPAVEAGLFPWPLQAAVSREAVLPLAGANALLIAGGINAGESSVNGIFRFDTASGGLSPAGSLPMATHDAAATLLGPRAVIFGGGTASPAAEAEDVSPNGSSQLLGSLPRPRADAAAVTIGGVAYLVGGYDGPAWPAG